MVTVRLFGTARMDFGEKELTLEACSVNELLRLFCDKYSVKMSKMKQYICFVNDVNITQLSMWRTKLKDGDKIMLLSPASGG